MIRHDVWCWFHHQRKPPADSVARCDSLLWFRSWHTLAAALANPLYPLHVEGLVVVFRCKPTKMVSKKINFLQVDLSFA